MQTTIRHREIPLQPFGLLIVNEDDAGQRVTALPADRLRELAREHGVVVLRGFAPLDDAEVVVAARRLGPLLEWEFGVLLNLRVVERPANHLFSQGRVELHWDGAYLTETPRFSFFQCRESTGSDGGETLFAHTGRVLERATPEQRARWSSLTVTYSTPKAAHYGGKVTLPLVGRHADTGAPNLRYIEADNEDNLEVHPVTVTVEGMARSEQRDFLRELTASLYAPEVMYRHAWEKGDFLMFDNEAVLHGRARLHGNVVRHIQRIHVLSPALGASDRKPEFIGLDASVMPA